MRPEEAAAAREGCVAHRLNPMEEPVPAWRSRPSPRALQRAPVDRCLHARLLADPRRRHDPAPRPEDPRGPRSRDDRGPDRPHRRSRRSDGSYAGAGHPSMFAYCVEELRLSEDAAYKRILAARAARRFPQLFELLATGRLHLTAVRLLAPHLTPENAGDLIAAAEGLGRSELESMLAQRSRRRPSRRVRDPLSCPARRSRHPRPTWPADPATKGCFNWSRDQLKRAFRRRPRGRSRGRSSRRPGRRAPRGRGRRRRSRPPKLSRRPSGTCSR